MKILICAPLQDAEIKKIQEYFINDTVLIKRRPTQEDIDQVDVIVGNPHPWFKFKSRTFTSSLT